MAIEVSPAVSEPELAALQRALATGGVDLEVRPTAYSSRWLRLSLREAVEAVPASAASAAAPYARSPRSTRGATRA